MHLLSVERAGPFRPGGRLASWHGVFLLTPPKPENGSAPKGALFYARKKGVIRVAYTQSEEYAELGAEVIREHPDLEWILTAEVSIGFLSSDQDKTHHGREVLGECTLVKPMYKPYCPHDFVITIYDPNVAEMTREQLKILMYHELLHVGVDDKTGDPKYKIVPHDIEDFRRVIDRYGVDWAVVPNG